MLFVVVAEERIVPHNTTSIVPHEKKTSMERHKSEGQEEEEEHAPSSARGDYHDFISTLLTST